jgi:hypothetical protein
MDLSINRLSNRTVVFSLVFISICSVLVFWDHLTVFLGLPLQTFDFAVEDKFLVYASHSGFSNQVLGLARAAILATLSRRVLVVPPILPHGRLAFGNAKSCHKSGQQRIINLSLQFYLSGQREGCFKDIFEFDEKMLFERAGLKMIDMETFLANENSMTDLWERDPFTLACGEQNGSRDHVKDHFSEMEDTRVLFVGSAFKSGTERLVSQKPNFFEQETYSLHSIISFLKFQ